jgi:hypothetical protein
MATRHLGTEFLLYVAAGGAPATPDEITNYTLVGQSTGITLDGTGESIVVRDKDGSTTLGSTTAYTMTGGWNQSGADDAGVAIIQDGYVGKTDIGWLITTNTTGHTQYRGEAVPTAFSRDFPVDAAATGSFTAGGSASADARPAVCSTSPPRSSWRTAPSRATGCSVSRRVRA